ncbi:hypothetical protein VCHENC02_5906, partial [Vibrio harveyi]
MSNMIIILFRVAAIMRHLNLKNDDPYRLFS